MSFLKWWYSESVPGRFDHLSAADRERRERHARVTDGVRKRLEASMAGLPATNTQTRQASSARLDTPLPNAHGTDTDVYETLRSNRLAVLCAAVNDLRRMLHHHDGSQRDALKKKLEGLSAALSPQNTTTGLYACKPASGLLPGFEVTLLPEVSQEAEAYAAALDALCSDCDESPLVSRKDVSSLRKHLSNLRAGHAFSRRVLTLE